MSRLNKVFLIIAIIISLAAIAFSALTVWVGMHQSNHGTLEKTDKAFIPAQRWVVDEQPGTVYYEIFVRAFADSNGDGIGDFNGVTAKLDYLQELGIGGIWLMPINASPSYHGYDVTDYYAVNPQYGTMDDLKELLAQAHKRDIKVIMDLVVNHTSSKHPWFKESANDKDSPYRDWYTWVEDDASKPSDGATGSYPWHSLNGANYLGIFWGGMPDLNFDHPAVREEMLKIGQFWLELGMDGFRLDAAKHIYGDFKSSESKPETVEQNQEWWQAFREGMNKVKEDAYIIGEVWDSPVVVAPYLNKFDSAFNFDLAGKLLSAAKSESTNEIAFFLNRTFGLFEKASNGSFIDAPFLTNHDQNRVMSVLQGNTDHAKMAASLLLTMPGNPFIYYGEEIGMKGMKPDEYIREPMVWGEEASASVEASTWIVTKHNEDIVDAESQMKDPNSLYHHYKQLITWRKQIPALSDGGIAEFISYNKDDGKIAIVNKAIAAYERVTEEEKVLVAHNLSHDEQQLTLTGPEGSQRYTKILQASKSAAKVDGDLVLLPPYSTVILQ
jgi:alpha-amylase